MHMTLRARIIDITPILLVVALVVTFAALVVVHHIVSQPVEVPASQSAHASTAPTSTARD